MKKIFLIFLVMLMPNDLLAYELGTFNLKAPTELQKGSIELKFQHRFRGKISEEPLNTFFGMDYAGANIGIDLRYSVLPKFDLNVSRVWDGKEYTAGASYAYSLTKVPFSIQLGGEFFSYAEFNLEKNKRKNGVFGLFSFRGGPILRVAPVVNVGYNSDNKEPGVGFGIAITALETLGIVQRLSAIGEYFPTTAESENKKSFAFGLRIETYSHHFDFILSNNSQIGVRHLMAGTLEDKGLRFGFNIKRLL